MSWSGVLNTAAIVLPILLSVFGVWVSVETPRLTSRKNRILWRSLLLMFGVLTTIAVIWQQNRAKVVAEAQFALKYVPSIGLVYSDKRLTARNSSSVNAYIWGDKLDGSAAQMDGEPRIVPPGMNYYFLADGIDAELRSKLKDGESGTISFSLYVSNDLSDKWTLEFNLLVIRSGETLTVHTQGIGMIKGHWEVSRSTNVVRG